jgi:glutamate 5-kinase
MTTKLQAAQAAARGGASTVLCNGNAKDVLQRVASGERVGTLFLAGNRLASRKHWLAFTLGARGTIVIDSGAARALVERGKSLLAAGIVEVRGKFGIGDPVACVDAAAGSSPGASSPTDRRRSGASPGARPARSRGC